MSKIDTTNWGEFKIGDLFEIVLAVGDLQANKLEDGNIPLVSSGLTNNGICKYIDEPKQICKIIQGNSLTVDMFGKAFYQPNPFYSVSHGRVNILIPKFSLNEKNGLFITSIIEKVTISKYSFSEMCSSKSLSLEKIKLPINKDGEPDFVYMEQYMQNRAAAVSDSLMALQSAKSLTNSKISTFEWKEFELSSLFSFKRGNIKNLQLLKEGAIPVIAAAGYNQGIAGFYDVKGEYINKITVSCNGAGCGSTFYHPYAFNINGDAMVLTEKQTMPDAVKLYISCLLNGILTRKYSYQEKCSPSKAENEKIKLPVDKNGNPNFEYMANFMKLIENNSNKKITSLKEIV